MYHHGHDPHPGNIGTVDPGRGTGTEGPGTGTGTGGEARHVAAHLGAAHLAGSVLFLGTVHHQGRSQNQDHVRGLKKNGRRLPEE